MGYRKHFLWTYLESLDTGMFLGEYYWSWLIVDLKIERKMCIGHFYGPVVRIIKVKIKRKLKEKSFLPYQYKLPPAHLLSCKSSSY